MKQSLNCKVLHSLPATLQELCAIYGKDTHYMNAVLYNLKVRGLVKRSDRKGMWCSSLRGRPPHLWVRT